MRHPAGIPTRRKLDEETADKAYFAPSVPGTESPGDEIADKAYFAPSVPGTTGPGDESADKAYFAPSVPTEGQSRENQSEEFAGPTPRPVDQYANFDGPTARPVALPVMEENIAEETQTSSMLFVISIALNVGIAWFVRWRYGR